MREHSMRIESTLAGVIVTLAMVACLAWLMLPATAQAYEGDALTAGSADVSTQADKVRIDTETLWAGCEYYMPVMIAFFPQNAKITSITSSNSKVIKPVLNSSAAYDNYLIPKKAGKSKITVKYKVGSKTKKVSATYTVKKYPKAYSSITVNGKKINVKKKKYYYDVEGYKKTSAKVNVKPAKGWKIISTTLWVGQKAKDVKNGKSFKIPKGKNAYAFFVLSNAKGDVIQYGIRFYR